MIRRMLLTAVLMVGAVTTARAQLATIEVDTLVTISSDTTVARVVVHDGGSLTMDGVLTVAGSVIVESGGTITHSTANPNGIHLVVSDSLAVYGSIHGDYRGVTASVANRVGEATEGRVHSRRLQAPTARSSKRWNWVRGAVARVEAALCISKQVPSSSTVS